MDTKPRKGPIIDELSIIKAAAWAWYQRGSGFEGRSMSEYEAARCSRVFKPSRYKLEAMRRAQEEEEIEEDIEFSSSFRSMLSPSHTDNSLLDRYEIERISKELDYYIKSSNNEIHKDGRKSFSLSENETSGIKGMKKKRMIKMKKRGFWLLGNGTMCGSRHDVVENIGFLRPRPE